MFREEEVQPPQHKQIEDLILQQLEELVAQEVIIQELLIVQEVQTLELTGSLQEVQIQEVLYEVHLEQELLEILHTMVHNLLQEIILLKTKEQELIQNVLQ